MRLRHSPLRTQCPRKVDTRGGAWQRTARPGAPGESAPDFFYTGPVRAKFYKRKLQFHTFLQNVHIYFSIYQRGKIAEANSMPIQHEHALSAGIENSQGAFDHLQVTGPTHDASLVEARMLRVSSSGLTRQQKLSSSSVDKRRNSDSTLMRAFNACQKISSRLMNVNRAKTHMEAEITALSEIRTKSI